MDFTILKRLKSLWAGKGAGEMDVGCIHSMAAL